MNEMIEGLKEKIPGKIILFTKTGSKLYGTDTPQSDDDYVGIFIANKEYQLGMKNIEEVDLSIKSKDITGKNTKDAVDIKFYEIRKFFKLCIKNNPNITELLFIDNPIYSTEEYEMIKKHSRDFLSKTNVANRFMGYALSQYKKMSVKITNFQELIKFRDLLLKENPNKILAEVLQTNEEIKKLKYKDKDKFIIFEINNRVIHKSATVKKVLQGVNGLLESASHRRKEWENGIDSKFLMHTIRLLIEGRTLLEKGVLKFPLPEREELKKLRSKKIRLDEAEELFREFKENFRKSEQNSILPEKSNFKKIDKLLDEIIWNYLKEQEKEKLKPKFIIEVLSNRQDFPTKKLKEVILKSLKITKIKDMFYSIWFELPYSNFDFKYLSNGIEGSSGNYKFITFYHKEFEDGSIDMNDEKFFSIDLLYNIPEFVNPIIKVNQLKFQYEILIFDYYFTKKDEIELDVNKDIKFEIRDANSI